MLDVDVGSKDRVGHESTRIRRWRRGRYGVDTVAEKARSEWEVGVHEGREERSEGNEEKTSGVARVFIPFATFIRSSPTSHHFPEFTRTVIP